MPSAEEVFRQRTAAKEAEALKHKQEFHGQLRTLWSSLEKASRDAIKRLEAQNYADGILANGVGGDVVVWYVMAFRRGYDMEGGQFSHYMYLTSGAKLVEKYSHPLESVGQIGTVHPLTYKDFQTDASLSRPEHPRPKYSKDPEAICIVREAISSINKLGR